MTGRGRAFCPGCGEWREVTVRNRAEDGTEKPCWEHRAKRTPTVGRQIVDANGYVRVQVGGGRGFVYEHRWVWEQANGPIPAGHHIHHMNGNKADNRLGNLQLIPGQSHNCHHTTGRHAAGALDNRGAASPRYRTDVSDTEIVQRRNAGESFRSIGRALGLSHNVIANHYRRAIEGRGKD